MRPPARARGRTGAGLSIDWTEPSWEQRRRLFHRDRHRINYADFVDRFAELYGRRTAFVLDRPIDYPGFSGSVLSYGDLARMVSRMAQALRALGVRRGDRVGLITMNRIEMAFCNFAAARIGAIPVPMNFMLRLPEINAILEKAGAEVLVCDRAVFDATIHDAGNLPGAKVPVMIGEEEAPPGVTPLRSLMADAPDHVPPVQPSSMEDVAMLFFTSGTTGLPKGATITHTGALLGMLQAGRILALKPRMARHLALLVMPVAHAGGYSALLHGIGLGMPSYFLPRFDPASILDVISRHRVTVMSGTPAMYRILLESGAREADLTSIRIWGGGADAFTDDLVRTMRNLATRRSGVGVRRKPAFIRGYGMAEANSYVAQTPPFECGDNCLGWVLPPVRYRIVDEGGRDVRPGQPGELWLTGPNVTKGYWNDPEPTAESIRGAWFRTGDIVRRGKWRMLYFVDRSSDILKCGGYKIAAAEIEQVLTQHPDVEHAAAIGVPDEIKGQRPMAAVKLRSVATATAEEILEWARERLAPYKCPRRIFVMQDMPFTFSLKPKRNEVGELIAALLEAESSR